MYRFRTQDLFPTSTVCLFIFHETDKLVSGINLIVL